MGRRANSGFQEFTVNARELSDGGGSDFRARAARVLDGRPSQLLIHLVTDGVIRRSGALGLLRVRQLARQRGTRVVLRPTNRAAVPQLNALGLGGMLANAA